MDRSCDEYDCEFNHEGQCCPEQYGFTVDDPSKCSKVLMTEDEFMAMLEKGAPPPEERE